MTAVQLEALAKAPWTSTIVGLAWPVAVAARVSWLLAAWAGAAWAGAIWLIAVNRPAIARTAARMTRRGLVSRGARVRFTVASFSWRWPGGGWRLDRRASP